MKKMSAVKKFIVMGSIILSMLSSPLSAVWPLANVGLEDYLILARKARKQQLTRSALGCVRVFFPFELEGEINKALDAEHSREKFTPQSITILNRLVKPLDDACEASADSEVKKWYENQMVKLTKSFRKILKPDYINNPDMPKIITSYLAAYQAKELDDFKMRKDLTLNLWDTEPHEKDSFPIRLIVWLDRRVLPELDFIAKKCDTPSSIVVLENGELHWSHLGERGKRGTLRPFEFVGEVTAGEYPSFLGRHHAKESSKVHSGKGKKQYTVPLKN